jgi:nucleoid-associated protein YgaU
MEKLQNAYIQVHRGEGAAESYKVQFNPTELSFEKASQNAEIGIPGLDSPVLQFIRGQNEKLTLELFFDSTEKGMGADATSVTEETDRFYSLLKIDSSSHAPPLVSFFWNAKFPGNDLPKNAGQQKRASFKGVVESIRQKFTLFSPKGVPLRATLTVVIREYKTLDEQYTQLNLTSPDRRHSHIVQSGDTLSSLAARYYRKPGEWRHIAEANGIEDPRRLTPGVFLTIPPIT